VNVSSFWGFMVFTIPSIIGTLISLILLFVLIKKPSWLLSFFLCFYLIGVAHLASVAFTSLMARSAGSFGIPEFWMISLAISRLRFRHAARGFSARFSYARVSS
jgi:hypothetical protein